MKALEYALAVAEIEAASLSSEAKAVALGSVKESHLQLGRKHWAIVRYISDSLQDGMTLDYAIETALIVYGYDDERWLRRLWYRYRGGSKTT